MRISTFILIIVLVILIILVIYTIHTYKILKKLTIGSNSTWNRLERKLQNKFDLIPEFLKIIKTYKIDENNTLKGIIESRNKWNVASTRIAKVEANNILTESLTKVILLTQEYSAPKKDKKLLNLKSELESIDDEISDSSNLYNDISIVLESKIKDFPSNIIAKLFKFHSPEIFKVSNTKSLMRF